MILYKYISPYLWNGILQNKLIRFTQAPIFNDPFELQPYYKSLAESDAFNQQINESNLNEEIKNQFAEAFERVPIEVKGILPSNFLDAFADFITPFAVENAPAVAEALMPALSKGLNEGFGKHIGILSLTEKPDNLLMWAHYALNHKGFVIGFDGDHNYFHQQRSEVDEFYYIRKVNYSENRPQIQIASAEDAAEIFLTKGKEWEYEQEWRMLKPINDATQTITKDNELIGLFSFPPDCVAEIILGCRMSESDRSALLDYLHNDKEYSHIKIYEAVLDDKEFKLNIIQL